MPYHQRNSLERKWHISVFLILDPPPLLESGESLWIGRRRKKSLGATDAARVDNRVYRADADEGERTIPAASREERDMMLDITEGEDGRGGSRGKCRQ